jgi:RimJ/RimL family protein N-acetyltransferase
MHHARHRQIHAVGAAIVERVRDAMREESAGSGTKQVFFRPRRLDNRECLGMASLEDADSVSPELGLWLKESAHGQGFGREVVAALVEWGHATLDKGSFIYPWPYKTPPAGVSLRIFTARS